ncbi:MAG: hypothetical protein ACU0GG_15515 [Paracoccaceae bacterium]
MVVALFKEDSAARTSQSSTSPKTRIVRFWLHQPNRLTDGHLAIGETGETRVSINLSTRDTTKTITERAAADRAAREGQDGYSIWDNAAVADLLGAMDIDCAGRSPCDVFADAVVAPVEATERAAADRLSIQWDVEERDIPEAIGLRYLVIQKAEAILNDAGLLVDPKGTVVADDTVAATLDVTEFSAAKSLLASVLTAEERRFNCRIQQV